MIPESEPDFRLSLWMDSRTVVIDGRLDFSKDEAIRVLRGLADRIERGDDMHMDITDLN